MVQTVEEPFLYRLFLIPEILIHRNTEVRVRQITDRHRDGNNISLEFKNPVMAHQTIS